MSETPPDLYYEVRGSGPVLLVIPGGAGHPMGLDGVTDRLADRFTVVTYDPLGLAHGRLGLPVEEQRVAAWSEGAYRVLGEVLPDGESAYVYGSSSGAIAALDLLARHPERLRRVVAHEPPAVRVLPDAARRRAKAMFTDVYDTYRTAGLEAAGARMSAGLEEQTPDATEPDASEPDTLEPNAPTPNTPHPQAQPPSPAEELSNPMALFLTRVLRHFTAYTPDLAALASHSSRLVLAAGADSRGQLLYRTAQFTAELSGSGFAEFPGGHIGVITHPVEYAERLAECLAETSPPVTTPGVPLTT
ncbi:alpha/beta fold hydrolase [Streptomyces sp. 2A115]|uniref:alpha/beta fold hydrolase n=1 Tax=Streptomyces sp. 2A115 TaxID=3457439 RepID=UPI003FD3C078